MIQKQTGIIALALVMTSAGLCQADSLPSTPVLPTEMMQCTEFDQAAREVTKARFDEWLNCKAQQRQNGALMEQYTIPCVTAMGWSPYPACLPLHASWCEIEQSREQQTRNCRRQVLAAKEHKRMLADSGDSALDPLFGGARGVYRLTNLRDTAGRRLAARFFNESLARIEREVGKAFAELNQAFKENYEQQLALALTSPPRHGSIWPQPNWQGSSDFQAIQAERQRRELQLEAALRTKQRRQQELQEARRAAEEQERADQRSAAAAKREKCASKFNQLARLSNGLANAEPSELELNARELRALGCYDQAESMAEWAEIQRDSETQRQNSQRMLQNSLNSLLNTLNQFGNSGAGGTFGNATNRGVPCPPGQFCTTP